MSSVWFPQCYWCKHFHSHTAMELVKTCAAFPERLPSDIFNGYAEHRMPYQGDHNIQFEEQTDTQALPEFLQEMTDEVREMIRKVMYNAMREKIRSLNGKKWQPDPNRME